MEGEYVFPTNRFRTVTGPGAATKTPLVLVACGSYSPITFLHLRLFEMARDDAMFNTSFSVVGGYLSPVNDRYAKLGLASAKHRVKMCQDAVDDTNDWLMVDPWEARQPRYLPTAQVLDHFDHEINTVRGGADVVWTDENGVEWREKRRVRIMLLAGSDLILTMSEPGVWAEKDLHHILGIYGCYIIERAESELDQTIFSSSSVHSRSPLALYRHNIHMVEQTVRNDVSSTKVRLFIRKGMSVRYLIPNVVIRYIERHGLYRTADRRRTSVLTDPSPSLTSATPSSSSNPSTSTSLSSPPSSSNPPPLPSSSPTTPSDPTSSAPSLSLPPQPSSSASLTSSTVPAATAPPLPAAVSATPSADEAERVRERERREERGRRGEGAGSEGGEKERERVEQDGDAVMS
ncbi:hypothetical protein JCM11251_005622 [Rhodosporidiobolus azoricus]